MKIRKFIVLLLICQLLVISLFSQEKAIIDNRLERGYQIEYLENLAKKSPSTLRLLTYNLDHSWFIAGDEINSKETSMEYLYYKDPLTQEKTDTKVNNIDINNLNIAEFYYEREYDTHKFYRIGNTGIIIGFYSALENAKRFNNHKNQ